MDIHARDDLWTDHDGQSRVMDYDAVEKELNRLDAEIERLRAALTKIADPLALDLSGIGFGRALKMITEMRNIAVAALAFEQKGDHK